ncbi:MAG: helix-turn-helix domain-containing protein [Roseburia sp.]|nr:helix-turn-helix domain-containing protein [Roseburia sp.]
MKKEITITFANNREKENEKFVIAPYDQEDVDNHNHDFFELAYITGGCAKHVLNDTEEIMVHKGNFFIIDYGTVHRYSESQELQLVNCLFLPEVIDETLAGARAFADILRVCLVRYYRQYPGLAPVNRIFTDEDGRIGEIIARMQAEYEKKEVGYQEIFRSGLMEILILIMRKVIAEDRILSSEVSYSESVEQAMEYLARNYREQTVLGSFCEKYHYSRQYISRRFKQETGITAMEYLHRIRMEKSCELLRGSRLSIQEISQAVGYEDVKFFRQIFQRFFHMAPAKYRKIS